MPQLFKPNIMLGADPEFFIRDKATKKIVSAHDLLPGTKDKPSKVPYGAIQVDGTAAEINIEPTSNTDTFWEYNKSVMAQVKALIGEGREIVIDSVAQYEPAYFSSLPDKARELGCDPDYNAWTGRQNEMPDSVTFPTTRFAGGHIHTSWTKGQKIEGVHVKDAFVAAKQLDAYVGIFCAMWDSDSRRRVQYGKAGACRVKPYGVEYRVPSNKWLRSSENARFVARQAYAAISSLFNGGEFLFEKHGEAIQKAINTGERWWKDSNHELFYMCNKVGIGIPFNLEVEEKKVANHTY